MGPYIAIVSLLAWTPRLAPLLLGVELVQFTVHVQARHVSHPMAPVSFLFMALGAAIVVLGSLVFPLIWASALLVVSQVLFSQSVHVNTHGPAPRWLWYQPVMYTLVSLYALWGMAGTTYVPGHPSLRGFLL
ncbi:hypothetical protein HY631_02690 [Candidatus Uhrbacteria bacterium]|nr:hypothetical protein [Candidatus Uhrbacteria bacterium]